MTPFSYEIREHALFVTGYLDERSDFSRIVGIFDKVNLQAVEGFSSIGLRQFMQFLYARDWQSISLQECPIAFIEAINAISALLKGTKIKIESLMVPFKCNECLIEVEILMECGDVLIKGVSISTPIPRCHKCRDHLRLHVDPHEYFLFLYN